MSYQQSRRYTHKSSHQNHNGDQTYAIMLQHLQVHVRSSFIRSCVCASFGILTRWRVLWSSNALSPLSAATNRNHGASKTWRASMGERPWRWVTGTWASAGLWPGMTSATLQTWIPYRTSSVAGHKRPWMLSQVLTTPRKHYLMLLLLRLRQQKKSSHNCKVSCYVGSSAACCVH